MLEQKPLANRSPHMEETFYDLTQLSFQGTGPDLEGSVQAWQKRRSSDDAGENGRPHFLPLTPLSEPHLTCISPLSLSHPLLPL